MQPEGALGARAPPGRRKNILGQLQEKVVSAPQAECAPPGRAKGGIF